MKFILFLGILFLAFACKIHPFVSNKKSENDFETSLYIVQGDTFQISLLSSYGSGHEWVLTHQEQISLTQLDSTGYVRTGSGEILSENNQTRKVFYFTAQKGGAELLQFSQIRLWERRKPMRMKSFRLIVQDKNK